MTNPDVPQGSTVGGSLGGKSARLVADAVAYTRQKMGPHQNALAQKVLADFTNHVSDEVRGVMGPLWVQWANDPDTPAELKPLFHALGTQRGQAWAWIGGSIAGAVTGNALNQILGNMLQPLVDKILMGDPNQHLSPEAAAQAAAHGFLTGNAALDEARRSGVNASRFSVLAQLAANRPAVGEVVELARRGDIDDDKARRMLGAIGVGRDDADLLLRLQTGLLTPEQLGAMWNRSIVTTDEGAAIAARWGLSRRDFERLTALGGEPLSPQELGEAFRRGFIDKARFNRGIVQGPIRNEWFDVIERLQYGRMSPVEAADAINQGHMSLGEGRDVAKAHGLDPDDFATIIEAAGAPPGIEFMEEAYNRGLISDAEWERAFKESRVKNRYIPLMRSMRQRLIPTETARLMYREGVYSATELVKTLKGHGFSDRDAQAQVELEDARRSESTKELSRAQVLDLYEEDIITESDAANMLRDIGFGQDETAWMMTLAEVNKVRRFVNAAVNRVKASYVANRIDASETANLLDEIGISPIQRDRLMSIWDIERDTVSAQLTTAQIQAAYRQGLIDDRGAYDRFLGRGYSPEDATILLTLAGGTPPAAP